MRHRIRSWIKKPARTARHVVRHATSRYRRLPDFIILGAQKSGTSSMFYYLSQHPDLLPSSKKEVHYFDGGLNPNIDTFKKGELWYRSHFPLMMPMSNKKITFEASPLYIFNPLVSQRIHSIVPSAKLVLILRNPVERTISHYFHNKRRGVEALPIKSALKSEQDRISEAIKNQDYKDQTFLRFSYQSRGIYHVQIERFYNYFPKSNLLILSSESLYADPKIAIQRVCEFVGVSPDIPIQDLSPRNVGTNRENIDTDIYEHLREFFEPYNRVLYKLVGEDFGW